jgi:hypothetical protein
VKRNSRVYAEEAHPATHISDIKKECIREWQQKKKDSFLAFGLPE